ncbi:LPXTG cell wall anchor domain-containing protein [Streptomyces iconiensis]|uniref:LPXTG cell wall anchor domain-containing protein n=1 Tax=Streptomyces iconiensis TaxID=1384038 RepID=A0ABT7A0M9_9ACTN|nr:LPXTG cell wall anchor domain-containing protein [Streptomyces iconiensis]MDJ1134885.1 LPXTG cell wall anchor domain-containing protein [Streptomyces iconiensis]
MPYGSITGPGGMLAATGLAAGQMWLVVAGVAAVLMGALAVRLWFRRGMGPGAR